MEKYAKYIEFSALSEEKENSTASSCMSFCPAPICITRISPDGSAICLITAACSLNRAAKSFLPVKDNEIAGVAIVKSTKEEAKICTLCVAKEHQRCGIGKKLMQLSLLWIEDDRIVTITLDSSKKSEFAGILRHFGFVLDGEKENMYTPGKTELMYARKPS